MEAGAPKTIAAVRAAMRAAVTWFRERAAAAAPAELVRLEARARAAIERVRKQYRHHVEDQLRRDAKRLRGLNEAERLGQEALLRDATDAALRRLGEAAGAARRAAADCGPGGGS